MFVRTLTETHTLPNTAFATRRAWHDARPQLPLHATRLRVSCRQLHASSRARSSTQPEAADTASSEAVGEQQVAREEKTSDPPTPQQVEDDRLFEIRRRSKNARKKARKYGTATAPPLAAGDHEARDTQATQATQATQDNQEAHEAQEVQEKRYVEWEKNFVKDETRRSKNSSREGRNRKDKDNAKEFKRRPDLEEKRKDDRPLWLKQKEALKAKFPEGWKPRKRLSPDALSGIRALNQQFPDIYTTRALSEKFEVSPEAIRRILRTKWEPAEEQDEDREQRWYRRGLSVWQRWAELGRKPPLRWQEAGVQPSPWNGRRREEGEEGEEGEQDDDGEEHGADGGDERLRRMKTQDRLAKTLM